MPTKKTWVLRLPEIRERTLCHECAGRRPCHIERLSACGAGAPSTAALLRRLSERPCFPDRSLVADRATVPLRGQRQFAVEQRRRQRLVECLEKLRRSRAGARVIIPVEAGSQTGAGLPAGVQLEPGMLRVEIRGCARPAGETICDRAGAPRPISKSSAPRRRAHLTLRPL